MTALQHRDAVRLHAVPPTVFDQRVDQVLHELAAAFHGAISYRTLRAAGVSCGAVERRLRSGSVLRAARGVYVIRECEGPWTALAAAQLRWPEAVACDRTAAALWGFDAYDWPDRHLLVRPQLLVRSTISGAPSGVRRTRTLDECDVTLIMGLRATAVVRTLVDLARQENPDDVERALESALRRRLTSVTALEDWLRSPRLIGMRGPVALRRVLDRRGSGVGPTASDPETKLVQLIRTAGLPPGVRQREIWQDGRFVARPDLFYPEERLAIEVDGSETHVGPRALQSDLDRQNRITLAGIAFLRFTYSDVTRRPRMVARRLASALEMRAPAPGR